MALESFHVPFIKELFSCGHPTSMFLVTFLTKALLSWSLSVDGRLAQEESRWFQTYFIYERWRTLRLRPLGPSKQHTPLCILPQTSTSRQSCLRGLHAISLIPCLVFLIWPAVSTVGLYMDSWCAFSVNWIYYRWFLHLSCRNISRMIRMIMNLNFYVEGLHKCDF